jgi:hypothetical protein
VSGVAFRVREGSAKRYLGGTALYFCCESCATYFSAHVETVLAQRGITISQG